ncbi:MAG: hypothetical protein Q4D51_11525, partial [Eubacteriales bacterium]|nr:hypothetical protein [Eubacteriales bacterium]
AGMSDMSEMPTDMSAMTQKLDEMKAAVDGMDASIKEMETLSSHMGEMRDAIPGAFDTALNDYIAEIDHNSDAIEECFQSTLNKGFSDIYLLTAITSVFALLILTLYRWNKEKSIA